LLNYFFILLFYFILTSNYKYPIVDWNNYFYLFTYYYYISSLYYILFYTSHVLSF
jgi:hypothetical protein